MNKKFKGKNFSEFYVYKCKWKNIKLKNFFFKFIDYYFMNFGFMLISGFYYMQFMEFLIYGCI